MKMFKNILLSLVFSVSLFACWQDPGPIVGIVPLNLTVGFNSIVGMNYYTSRLVTDESTMIKIDWPEGSTEDSSYWMLITSQTEYLNKLDSGLPITLYFNVMSKTFKDYLISLANSDNEINDETQLESLQSFLYADYSKVPNGMPTGEFKVDPNENDVIKDVYLYYKVVSSLTTQAQQNAVWHLCGEVHLTPENTNVHFPGNNGTTLFGKDTLTKKMIEDSGETISIGDYIIFFMYAIQEDGTSNVDQNSKPQIKNSNPILPDTCLGSTGPGYQIGHIFTVRYDGTEIYHK